MKYSDPNVCRLFLVGLCPRDKLRPDGVYEEEKGCPKKHLWNLREAYEKAESLGKVDYDRDVEDAIVQLINKCDSRFLKALKSLKDEDANAVIAISVSKVTQNHDVLLLSSYIEQYSLIYDKLDHELKKLSIMEMVDDEKIYQVEKNLDMARSFYEQFREQRASKQEKLLSVAFHNHRVSLLQQLPNPPPAPSGKQGKADEAEKALEEATTLIKTEQEFLVCDICGTLVSVREGFCHFQNSVHQLYAKMRERLADFQFERKVQSRFYKGLPIEDRAEKWWVKMDWRLMAPLTTVQDQKQSDICWIVAPTDASSIFLSQNGETVELSPTPLIDCCIPSTKYTFDSFPNQIAKAFQYIKTEGLPSTKDVPFSATKFPCGWRSKENITRYKIPNFTRVGVDESLLLQWLPLNPLVIGIQINQTYNGHGIYLGSRKHLDKSLCLHGVLLYGCGYLMESDLNYWIIKNSYGQKWGEGGYCKIVRRSSMPNHRPPIIMTAYAPSFGHW